uniref:EB domain-containing protein n=2 Tax=Graphocephala atropunctata TaxID=36148 RepID=A0A1B6KBY1_9HEMI
MRRRRLTVWLLLLVAAHGARTADPQLVDSTATNTEIPETTTESMEGRGNKKFGDRCETTEECGFRGSFCDQGLKSCQCLPKLSATNHIDKCGQAVGINESCFFNEQCEVRVIQTECRDGRCACRFEMTPVLKHDQYECIAIYKPPESERYVDPTMIGILVAMALMFVIICVVLRLFSKARWRENRTIFNTPNPRLMNVSLLQHNKHPTEQRRGSRGSVRAPSRQPSMASLRPTSPNASQGSRISRCGSRGSSGGSTLSPTKMAANNVAHSNLAENNVADRDVANNQEPSA